MFRDDSYIELSLSIIYTGTSTNNYILFFLNLILFT